jgi:hypothetical protein
MEPLPLNSRAAISAAVAGDTVYCSNWLKGHHQETAQTPTVAGGCWQEVWVAESPDGPLWAQSVVQVVPTASWLWTLLFGERQGNTGVLNKHGAGAERPARMWGDPSISQ